MHSSDWSSPPLLIRFPLRYRGGGAALGSLSSSSSLLTLAFLLLLPLASGCSHFKELLGLIADKPKVSLKEVEVEAFAIDSVRLVFVLDVLNPNDFSLDINDLDYKVRGLGIELGEGRLTHPFKLAAAQSSQVRLPFRVEPQAAYQLFRKYLAQPRELKLQFDGRFFIGTAFGNMDMHFLEEKTMVRGLKGF